MTAPLAVPPAVNAGAIRAAFAAVPREAFVGPPPWQLYGRGALLREFSIDPADLYEDVLVALDAAKGINNGSPSLHARMLELLAVAPGDSVLHVGAGTGYYSAILAELAGAQGHVTAVEFDAALAAAARQTLRPWPQVEVFHADGATFPRAPVQRIYVSFAVAEPAAAWLDGLVVGGTLVVPLGVPDARSRGGERNFSGRCAVLAVTRARRGLAASFAMPAAFICAEGPTAGDPALRAALWAAFGRGGLERVQSLIRGPADPHRSWMTSARFSLGFDPP